MPWNTSLSFRISLVCTSSCTEIPIWNWSTVSGVVTWSKQTTFHLAAFTNKNFIFFRRIRTLLLWNEPLLSFISWAPKLKWNWTCTWIYCIYFWECHLNTWDVLILCFKEWFPDAYCPANCILQVLLPFSLNFFDKNHKCTQILYSPFPIRDPGLLLFCKCTWWLHKMVHLELGLQVLPLKSSGIHFYSYIC